MDFLISFDDLKAGAKALNRLRQAFTRAGAPVATADVDPKTKRTSGVNYRQVMLTFTDNQSVTLSVKTTGDIYEVRVNGSVLPIKNQGDQRKAVGEIVKALDAGRAKHQAKMARQKAALPKGITTAAPRMEQKIAEAQSNLDERIAAVKAEIVELKTELGEAALDAVLDSREPYNPKTDRWVSTENGSKLLIRDGSVIGGAGGKLNSSPAKKPFPKDGLGQVKAAQAIFSKSAKSPHTVKSFAEEAGISVEKARKLVDVFIAQGRLHDPTNNGRIEWNDNMKLHPDSRYLDSATEAKSDDELAAAMDAVDVPTASFDDPAVIEAQAIAGRILNGDTLDAADLSHALATLDIALSTVETNRPINLAEGNVEQAELEERAAESFRSAMQILETQREPAAA